MSNRVTLDQLEAMPAGEVAALPADWLALLLEDAEKETRAAKDHADRLAAALDLRYGGAARARLVEDGRDAGTARIGDGGFVAVVEVPKRVAWDQEKLRRAIDTVESWGSDPGEFVTTRFDVSERAYAAWPSEIRTVFASARTVVPGKARIRLEPRATEAAKTEGV